MKPDGGPAFPDYDHNGVNQGMSMRDYFAAKFAHAEMVTAGALREPAQDLAREAAKRGRSITEQVAYNAYLLADAMLKERDK